MKSARIGDFLTDEQIQLASKLGSAGPICEQVIKPNMAEIDRKLGQKNDARYLAYAVEYALTAARVAERMGVPNDHRAKRGRP